MFLILTNHKSHALQNMLRYTEHRIFKNYTVAMNQMKIVISTILRNAKFESLGRREDIQISTQLVLRVESLPKMKFFKL